MVHGQNVLCHERLAIVGVGTLMNIHASVCVIETTAFNIMAQYLFFILCE